MYIYLTLEGVEQPQLMYLHQNLEEGFQRLESSQNHVNKGSIVCRSKTVDSDAKSRNQLSSDSASRSRQRLRSTPGQKRVGLYKKGKIRVQVILN